MSKKEYSGWMAALPVSDAVRDKLVKEQVVDKKSFDLLDESALQEIGIDSQDDRDKLLAAGKKPNDELTEDGEEGARSANTIPSPSKRNVDILRAEVSALNQMVLDLVKRLDKRDEEGATLEARVAELEKAAQKESGVKLPPLDATEEQEKKESPDDDLVPTPPSESRPDKGSPTGNDGATTASKDTEDKAVIEEEAKKKEKGEPSASMPPEKLGDAPPMQVMVGARLCPFTREEIAQGINTSAVRMSATNFGAVELLPASGEGKSQEFKLDAAFNSCDGEAAAVGAPFASQGDIYTKFAQPAVEEFLNGKNALVLVQGQTGSGKATMMLGAPVDAKGGEEAALAAEGIFPRSCREILAKQGAGSSLHISVVEVYCEMVNDLFEDPDDRPSRGEKHTVGSDGGDHTVDFEDLSSRECKDMTEVARCISLAKKYRTMGDDLTSHRATVVYRISKKGESGSEVVLNFVKSPGSEPMEPSGNSGQTLREGNGVGLAHQALNQWLRGSIKGDALQYRGSGLTLILRAGLEGTTGTYSKCFLLVGLSPNPESYSETLATLRGAQRYAWK